MRVVCCSVSPGVGSAQCECAWYSCSGSFWRLHSSSYWCVCVRGCVSACTLHSVSHFLHIPPTYPPTLTTGPHIHKTGGADKTAIVFQKDSKQIVATLKGHTKKVSGAVYHPREVSNVTIVTKLPIHHVLNEAIGWEPMESSKENTLEVVCPWEMPIAVKLLSRALLISEAFYFRLSS